MLWLIGQIIVFLIIAALIGFVIGWLIRTLWPSARNRAREGELSSALERASSRIADLEAGLRSKRVAATAAAEQEEAALRRVEELEASLANLDSRGDADTGEASRLQSELEEAIGSIDSLRTEVEGLQTEAASITALREERDAALARIAELEARTPEPSQAGLFLVPDDPGGSPEPQDAPEPEVEPEDLLSEEEIEALRLDAVAAVAERFAEGAADEPDDLKRIRGIGPVLERTLHDMNITTYRQIADFDDDDIELVSAALGRAFPDRVRRDDWMSGARDLLPSEPDPDPEPEPDPEPDPGW